jgi:hypothetical protein
LAGVASFVLGQRFAENAPRPDPPTRGSLPITVESIGRPFYTEPAPGHARHRLRYRHRHQTWYLETDVDGDGRFEFYQTFRTDGSRTGIE